MPGGETLLQGSFLVLLQAQHYPFLGLAASISALRSAARSWKYIGLRHEITVLVEYVSDSETV
jgi:hypothetical protein